MKKITFLLVFLLIIFSSSFAMGTNFTIQQILNSILVDANGNQLNANVSDVVAFNMVYDQTNNSLRIQCDNCGGSGSGDVTGIDGGDGIRIDDGTTATPEVNLDFDENTTNLESTAVDAADVIVYQDSDNSDDIARGLVSDLPFQSSDATLAALAAYNTNGLLTQTSSDTFTGRTITATANETSVSNGNGVSGNPVIGIADNPILPGNQAMKLVVGTTGNRPGSPALGHFRENSSTGYIERYDGSGWRNILDSADFGVSVQAYDAGLLSVAGLSVTNGDIIYATGDDAYAKLDNGAEGTLLMANGAGAPSWLGAGTSGYFLLGAGAADPVWTTQPTLASLEGLSFTDGDIIYASGADTLVVLNSGTQDYLLQANGAGAPNWETDISVNSVTTAPSATPGWELKDSDSIASPPDINAEAKGNLTDTGDGTEDMDVEYKQQEAGALVTYMKADADANLELGRSGQPVEIKDTLQMPTNTAGLLLVADGTDYEEVSFVETELIPVGWMIDGASAPDALETITSGTDKVEVRTFSGSADEDTVFTWQVPNDCDVTSGIKFRVVNVITVATGPSGETWQFELQGFSMGSGDALDGTLGTAQTSNSGSRADAQYDIVFTAWSGAMTSTHITGLAVGELAQFKFYRDVDDTDTYVQLVGVAFIQFKYKRLLNDTF